MSDSNPVSSALTYRSIAVTPFQQNCSVVRCNKSGKGCIIDPGGDLPQVLDVVRQMDVQVEKILVTHGHLDHAGQCLALQRELDVEIYGPHREDGFWLEALALQGQMMGIEGGEPFVPNHWLEHGGQVRVGELRFDVIHCPGHTPGHVVFFEPQSRLAFVGDVLFAGSIGRTDFPRGNLEDLLRSIRERLFPLGDDVEFIPGHGPNSTFGTERKHNPFVSASYG